ncbi:preprotein translocase subunit YajC [Ectothiorhodospiraceae bacterium BW-2]|nr:preprotein translocase subunit YajC [Ectothiorhodospiraceae bacterium BW-2]
MMSFFIGEAWAEGDAAVAGAAQQPGLLEALFPFIILFIVFYFLLIRPQQKRVKQHKAMTEALQKGDEVITNGGILGKVTELAEEFLTIEIAEGVVIRVQRSAVATVMPKGTIKELL